MKYSAESAGRDLSPLFFISARRCALTARGSSTPEERVSPQFICGVRLRWGVKPAGRNIGAWPADMFKSKTLSQRLCPVKSPVRRFKKFFIRHAVIRKDTDSYPVGNPETGRERPAHGSQGGSVFVGQQQSLFTADVVEQQKEFIASDSPDEIIGTERVLQGFRYEVDDAVAELVPVCIIGDLEIVNVDDQHGMFAPWRIMENLGTAIAHEFLVQQARHGIPACQIIQIVEFFFRIMDIHQFPDNGRFVDNAAVAVMPAETETFDINPEFFALSDFVFAGY